MDERLQYTGRTGTRFFYRWGSHSCTLASQTPSPETSLPHFRWTGFFESVRHGDELVSTTTSMLYIAKSELLSKTWSGEWLWYYTWRRRVSKAGSRVTGRSYERKFVTLTRGWAMALVLKRKLPIYWRLSMVPKVRSYRPKLVNSTSIRLERSLISWKFISRNIASAQEGDQSVQMSKQHKMIRHKRVIFLRSFGMTDPHSSCHGSDQRIRVEVASLTVIHMAFILCRSRVPNRSTIAGRNNLRCLPPCSSPSFRSNLTRQIAESTSVTNSCHSLPSIHISCVEMYICHPSSLLCTSWSQVIFFSWSQISASAMSVSAEYRLTSPSHRTAPSDAACECL